MRLIPFWIGGMLSNFLTPLLVGIGVLNQNAFGPLFFAGLVCWTVALGAYSALNIRQMRHLERLGGTIPDAADVGCWLDVLNPRGQVWWLPAATSIPYMVLMANARNGVLAYLTYLRPEDPILLSPAQRKVLFGLLHTDDVPMVLALLKTLPLFADPSALPFVQQLAAGKGLAASLPPIQGAARSALREMETGVLQT